MGLYFALLAFFVIAVSWRITKMGGAYLFAPGGFYTAMVFVVTITDLIPLSSDEPNVWPTSKFVDPYDLRFKPLLLLTLSMLAFWLAESIVLRLTWGNRTLRRPAPNPERDVILRRLGALIIGVAIPAQLFVFISLGVSSLEAFLTNSGQLGWRMGSEGFLILNLAFNLLPVGVAFALPRQWLDSALALVAVATLLVAVGFFLTASKGGALLTLLFFTLAAFWRLGRLPKWARRPVVVLAMFAVISASIAIKTQYKYESKLRDTTPEGMMESLRVGAGRFEGGTFQTYCVIVSEVGRLNQFRGGSFNAAAVTNVVPRVLWRDKPVSPVGTLFHYLIGVDDPSGAALMAQGAFYLDWGAVGMVVGLFAAGLIFGLMDLSAIAGDPTRFSGAFAVPGVIASMQFLEGGLVSFVPTIIGLVALWVVYTLLIPRRVGDTVEVATRLPPPSRAFK